MSNSRTEDSSDSRSQALLAIGLVIAAIVALVSFSVTVAPAGMEAGPEKGATFKQVSTQTKIE